jgi:phage/plasmid primase-like uncharacterized protein
VRFERQTREASDEYAHRGSTRWEPSTEERDRMRQAQEIARGMLPAAGTLAERYLRNRGIRIRLPPVIGFAPKLYFGPARRQLPALVAVLHDSGGRQIAVQRTFLDTESGRKAEPASEAKRTLGPMHDCAVKLSRPSRVLGLAEGLETALSASQLFSIPIWATLGNARFTAVKLPPEVEQLVLFADNGKDGRVDPRALQAAEELDHRGIAVVIEAPEGVKDWNDHLRTGSPWP